MYVEAAGNDGKVTAARIARRAAGTIGSAYQTASDTCRGSTIWTSHHHDGYRLTPCTCGSYQRYPMRFREAAGPVCGHCHHDNAGIYWDPELYARWRAHPALWNE